MLSYNNVAGIPSFNYVIKTSAIHLGIEIVITSEKRKKLHCCYRLGQLTRMNKNFKIVVIYFDTLFDHYSGLSITHDLPMIFMLNICYETNNYLLQSPKSGQMPLTEVK